MDRLIKLNIWILVCLLVGFTACADLDNEPVQKENSITIRLSNHKMSRSEGEVDFNENLIKCADIFFFSTDAQGTPTGNCLLHHKEADINKQTNHEFSISLNDLPLGSYYIYAIANLDEGIGDDYDGTISDLKSLVVPAITVTTVEGGNNGVQPFFVMDGNKTMAYTEEMEETIVIPLERSAAKITLTVTVDDYVVAGGTTYESVKDQMTVELMHGEENGVVNGVTNSPSLLETGQYNINTSMTHDIPFYSYPTDIERTISNESKECYLELMIPWTSENGTVRNYYYHIPIEKDNDNNTITALERNHHYMMTVQVSILGSLEEEEETVDLLPKYVVQNWSEVALDADLKNYRYLWVKEPINGQYWEMKNTNVLEIPYNSSHPCKILSISCQQKDLSMPVPEFKNVNFDELNLKDGYIYFENELVNDFLDNNFDFSPYYITFTIQHEDNENYKEEISIIQYPAIYGEAIQNSDYANDDNINGNNGFVFVNGYTKTNNGVNDFFCSANGLSTNAYAGASPNMYIFTVTSVAGTEYVIGDPRNTSSYTYTENDAKWASANSLNGEGSRELKYYYGTAPESNTENIIAPKFRIASAYAVLNTGANEAKNLENLRKRCASYQEDGYPAGRWRLPTKSEFEFIFSLVNRSKLPAIYQLGSEYWCAHGLGDPQNNGTVNISDVTTDDSGHSVRCVYDDWYWGSEPALDDKSIFTWGDEPINK